MQKQAPICYISINICRLRIIGWHREYVLLAKLMNKLSKEKINPLIGSAGVSAVPMAARVSNKVGLEANSQNFLLMHAMGPNVAGVIGSAVAAGVLLALVS